MLCNNPIDRVAAVILMISLGIAIVYTFYQVLYLMLVLDEQSRFKKIILSTVSSKEFEKYKLNRKFEHNALECGIVLDETQFF